MKKERNNNGVFYVVISLFAVFSVLFSSLGIVAAYSAVQTVNVAGDYIYNEATSQPETGNVTLGAFPGGDIYNPVVFYDKVGYGEGRQSTSYFVKAIPFTDATITPVLFNPDSEGYDDFYLVDAWVEIKGKATTTVKLAVSTTTATVMTQETIRPLLDAAGSTATLADFSTANQFGADGATVGSETATSSQLSIFKYPGTDTRIASNLEVKIASTTNVVVVATSSDFLTGGYSINGAEETFDGTLYLVGREVN